ncbi:MAG: putative transrane anti-sigma factor [Bryobacterales bacterium]|nr:putative transrane anti-sigma factor [Bryobacterales bacterium]
MHEVVRDELEHHLTGNASPAFYTHVKACATCREEIAEMEDLAKILRGLTTPAPGDMPVPSPGFYARVANTINEQQPKSAWANLFSPGYLFFRRVAFASLLVLTLLGAVLITTERSGEGADATSIMAQYDSTTSHAPAAERDSLLVTLAAYHE